jgi:hypothetical protein
LFEKQKNSIVLRAATPVKLVEMLFSPYYGDESLTEDILDTFEVNHGWRE